MGVEQFDFFHNVQDHVPGTALLSVLIAIGAFQCFFGYRFFKVSVFLCGFVSGFVLTTMIVSKYSSDTKTVYLSGVAAGVGLGWLCSFLVSVGRILLGVVCGVALGYLAYLGALHEISYSSHKHLFYAIVGGLGLVGGLIGYKAGKPIIIIFTGLGGAVLMFRSIDLLANNKLSLNDVKNSSLSSEGWGMFAASLAVGLVGIAFQFSGLPTRNRQRIRHTSQTSPLLS
eukprot:c23435_g1_i1.p1 GENE.c23435_g1_i1~~c23435_g1_i1.p1  ORF type:complete len:246 (+),score=51.71 c23435_g1_i1:56-739(+)